MENNISPRVDEIENEVVNISLSGYNKYFTLGISYGSPVHVLFTHVSNVQSLLFIMIIYELLLLVNYIIKF
jgi:hypothetical protein